MPGNAGEGGPVPSGGHGNSGTSPHPTTFSFPRVAAWALWMLAQPARGGGENQDAKRCPVCSAPGLGARPALRGVRAGERPRQPPLPLAPFRGAAPALRAARGPASGPAPRSFGLGWSEEPGGMAGVQGRGLNDRTPRPRHPRLLWHSPGFARPDSPADLP